MQAQDYVPAKWSVGQRASGILDEDVDRAVAAGAIVRTHVLRVQAAWGTNGTRFVFHRTGRGHQSPAPLSR